MSLVKTESFELAIYSQGDPNSQKLALVLPGKLDTKDYSHIKSHVDFLANLGYFALSFDPPGTWESPGGIDLYTVTNYLKAVDEVVEYYGKKPTFIMGHSRGATIATIAGVRNKYIFAFAAVMSSFSKGGFQESADNQWKAKGFAISRRDLPPGGGAKEKEFKLPYSFYEDQTKYDLTNDITDSSKPKLFILGKRDDLIPPEIIKETFNLFADPKELYDLNSDHNYRHDQALIKEVNEKIGEFLKEFDLESRK